MRRKRLVLGGAAAGLTAVALLLGGVFHDSSSSATPVSAVAVSTQLQGGFSAGQSTETVVANLQSTLRAHPEDVNLLGALGLAYEQRARETGDPTYYTKADEVLHGALRLEPHDLTATSGLGSLALSRHRFGEALLIGRRAIAISPTTALDYGIVGDALVELGRYPAAWKAFDTMATMRPSLSAYARVSHGRELLGDLPGAIRVMQLALDASSGQGEAEAWTHVQLGKLYWSVGRVDATGQQDRAALRVFPGYHYALDALSRVEAAHGRYRSAIALEREAVDRIPLPQSVAQLGDLYHLTGHQRQAQKQYALVAIIQRLLVANGVKTDLETALFQADHSINLPQTLALARLAHRERPSIDGDDVLAWALERTGDCGTALRYSKQALHLGTRDALKYFHRGMIERCLGHRAAARSWLSRALGLNPNFSLLWTQVARRELQ